MFTVIMTYIVIGVFHGIAYTALAGLAPAWYYLTRISVHNPGEITDNIMIHSVAFFSIWAVSFVLLKITGPFAGFFVIIYGIMYFLSLHQRFIFTVILTIITGFVYEVIHGRIEL